MISNKSSSIVGTGSVLPGKPVTNDELVLTLKKKGVETSDKWIKERTGISQRYIISSSDSTSSLGLEAAKIAIKDAGIAVEEIDLVIVATTTPDHIFPSVACYIQGQLGIKRGAAFDVQAVCSGFVYGLTISDLFIKADQSSCALVIGAETLSDILNWQDRSTCVLFGDGAGAALLSRSNSESSILSTHLHSDGKHLKSLWMEAPGTSKDSWVNGSIDLSKFTPKMNGREVFRNAVTRFPEVINEALDANNLDINDIKFIVPHQANYRISEAIAKKLNIKMDKVISNIHKYGNTTAASIPIALAEALESNKISKGDIIILAAFGAGFTWASAAIRW